MTATLHVQGVAKRFGAVAALTDASFHVRPGELLGLIGPNGAGKTTLLECVAGIQTADAGSVALDKGPLLPAHRKDALFYLPDGMQPWPDQRTAWVLEFAEGLFAAPAGAREQLVASLQLAPLLNTRVGALSKGERKRVNIALGLLAPQPLLLFDEPFDGLDLRQAREVAGVLRAHAAQGRGLCLSIHQLADAVRICDRLVLLAGGATVGEGTLEQLREQAGGVSGGVEEIFLALT